MHQPVTRPWITAGVAVVGAGVIAVTPVVTPPSSVHLSGIALTAEDITIDFVRHGQSTDNVDNTLGTVPPGAHLTELGEQQAADVAPVIQGEYPDGIDGIYASELIRTQETAQPLADLLDKQIEILPGLNEINAGILEGLQLGRLGEILYIIHPLLWVLGFEGSGQWFSTIDPNGFAFDERFGDAVQTIYDNTVDDPNAPTTDVAFSHAAAIMTWVLMNAKNANPLLMLTDPLDNTGQVVIEGNPEDGWTILSWNGTPIDPDPSMATQLFVDFRDLILAPQIALNDVMLAIDGGDPDAISTALQDGLQNVFNAVVQFPGELINDISGALSDGAAAATI